MSDLPPIPESRVFWFGTALLFSGERVPAKAYRYSSGGKPTVIRCDKPKLMALSISDIWDVHPRAGFPWRVPKERK